MSNKKFYLFYIAGHSAVGKSTLLSHLIKEFPWPVMQKVSTRGARSEDSQSLEVFPIHDEEFMSLLDQGLLTANYEKYGKKYAFFSRTGMFKIGNDNFNVVGFDQIQSNHVFAVGDAYHATIELKKLFPNLFVMLLYAHPKTIEARLREKALPESQLQERIKSLEKECTNDGFPIGVPFYDYAISTDVFIAKVVESAKRKIEILTKNSN